jgi:hypothetical protein
MDWDFQPSASLPKHSVRRAGGEEEYGLWQPVFVETCACATLKLLARNSQSCFDFTVLDGGSDPELISLAQLVI